MHAWRHPRVDAASGRCIGRTDLAVDPRRARRLAHRIRSFARRHALPRVVVTSPLARSRAVGQQLARWGWRHRIDPALSELDFGQWDGRCWSAVPIEELDAWNANFAHHAPGGGETVAELLDRVRGFDAGDARIVVTHGGWLSAAMWLGMVRASPTSGCGSLLTDQGVHAHAIQSAVSRSQVPLLSADWPPAPPHGRRIDFRQVAAPSLRDHARCHTACEFERRDP